MIRLIVGQSKVPMDDQQNAGRKAERMEYQTKKMLLLLLLHETTKSMARTNPTAIPKDFQDQAEARQEGQAEPTYPPMVPIKD